jgi:hypothetical protein
MMNINLQEFIMRVLIILFILSGNLFSASPQNCVIRSLIGQIEMREPYQTEWKQATENVILADRTTIRSYHNSSAQIKTYTDDVFTLPSNAQIEIQELRQLDRNQIVLELTALDLQKLPAKADSIKDNTAFILHGSLMDKVNDEASQNYISLEISGAMALFDQGYIAGFIIKWHKLSHAFSNIKSEKGEQALAEAYRIMNMPARLKEINKSGRQN